MRVFVMVLLAMILPMGICGQVDAKIKKPASSSRVPDGTPRGEVSGGAIMGVPMQLEGTIGGVFMDAEWKPGVVILKDQTRIEGRQYRYNVLAQQMQFVDGEDTLAFAQPDEIDRLHFDDKTFVWMVYEVKGEVKSGYFELLEEGPCKLLKRRMVNYRVQEEEDVPGGEWIYLHSKQYFVSQNSQPAKLILCTKNCLKQLWPDDKSEMLHFMRENRLKLHREADLKKVIAHYNEMHP